MLWIIAIFILLIPAHYWSTNKKRIERIENEGILIIGASKGIGKALAAKLAKRNCRLLLVSRNLEELERAKNEIIADKKINAKIYIFQADWTKQSDLEKLLLFAKANLVKMDKLILSAGVLSTLPFVELTQTSDFSALLQNIFQVNSIAPIMTTKVFLPVLLESRGSIVVLSSAAGVIGAPTRTLYSATKHAVNGFFRSLRIELRPMGVKVFLVMPGSVKTDLRRTAIDANYSKVIVQSGISPESCAQSIIEGVEDGIENLFLPKYYRFAAILNHLTPTLIDYFAQKKYQDSYQAKVEKS